MSPTRLLVGIGSPHGDDAVGWEIARRVGERAGKTLSVRCASSPAELLDWLEGLDTLEVCDAVVGGNVGSIHCWRWPAGEIEQVRFRGSHDMGLAVVLTLAAELGRLPAAVRVWGVGIHPPAPNAELSPAATAAASEVAERICSTLALA